MRTFLEKFTIALCWLGCIVLLGTIFALLTYLFSRSLPAMSIATIWGTTSPIDAILLKRPVFDGLFPAIIGSLMLILIATTFATPLGLATGIYLAEYASPKPKYIISLAIDVLAGLPSIVIGLAGFSLTIILHKLFHGQIGPCLLISGIALGFLILPYIVTLSQNSLESCPNILRSTALALGATTWQNIRYVLIPYQLPRIVCGIVLAIGRAAEDTAVIMLTGAVVSIGVPRSFLDQFEALPFYIYYISAQYTDQNELAMGFAAAFILLSLCLILFFIAHLISWRFSKGTSCR